MSTQKEMVAPRRPVIEYDELVKEDRVHGIIYTSPEIFEEELQKIFHRQWVYVGHTSEIPQAGDYRVTWIGRQSVIMARDEDSEVRLLMNRCRHRATAVCQYERGNASFFRCAYHGWTYSNRGALVGVPQPGGYDESFRKEDYGLTRVPRVSDYRGFIFASLSPTGITLDEHLGKAKSRIDIMVDASPVGEIEVRAGVHKGNFKGNWKFVGMDGYHPHVLHRSVVEQMKKKTGRGISDTHRGDPFSDSSGNLTRDLGNGHVMLDLVSSRKSEADGFIASLRKKPGGADYIEAMEKSYGKERALELITWAGDPHIGVFPNLQLIGVQIRTIRPIRVDETEVFMYPVLLKGVPPEINAMRLRQHESFYGPAGHGSPDDNEIFERNQIGLSAQLDPWLLLSRGLNRERRDEDGTLIASISDEVTQRGQMRQYKKWMSQA